MDSYNSSNPYKYLKFFKKQNTDIDRNIKDFIEVNVKNDEHLVRIAQIAQRIVGAASKGENIDGLLTEAEKQALLGDLKAEFDEIKQDSEELDEAIFAVSNRVKK